MEESFEFEKWLQLFWECDDRSENIGGANDSSFWANKILWEDLWKFPTFWSFEEKTIKIDSLDRKLKKGVEKDAKFKSLKGEVLQLKAKLSQSEKEKKEIIVKLSVLKAKVGALEQS